MRGLSAPLLGVAWQGPDAGGYSPLEGDWHLQDVARARLNELKGMKWSWLACFEIY